MRAPVLLPLAALLLPAAAPTPSLRDAEMFVRRIYAPYLAGPGAASPSHDPAVFTREMLDLIRRDEEIAGSEDPTLDGDPICYCQEYDRLRDLTVAVRPAGTGRARAAVTFATGDSRQRMTFSLVTTAAGWRIADIDTPQDGSLAVLIRDGIAKRTRRAKASPSATR